MSDESTIGPSGRIGSDRFLHKGDDLVVYSRVDMPDWTVGKYRRTAVIIGGSRYGLTRKDILGKNQVRYILRPWPKDSMEIPGKTIQYDDSYVKNRDDSLRTAWRNQMLGRLLRMLQPLLGFLFYGTKLKMEERFGISVRSATVSSLYLEFFCFLAAGLLATLNTLVEMRHLAVAGGLHDVASLAFFVTASLLLLADLIVRYGRVLGEMSVPPGFYEWLFRRRRDDTSNS